MHGTGEGASGSAAKMFRKAGLTRKGHDASAGDKALNEERTTFTRDGKQVPGFADAMVPTLEEKTVQERLPEKSDANGSAIKEEDSDNAKATTADDAARTEDGELFGAPADASLDPKSDDQPPHDRSGVNDADEQEQAAPGARNMIRKNLAGKSPGGPWTLPTPTPTVDADGFEDPISDAFWKKVWVACAVHNVGHSVFVTSTIY